MTRTPPGTLPEPAVPEPAVPERSARVASIVGATRAILVEQGWEAVSMRTIAAALGITAPSLYKHVKNKDALAALLITDGLLAMGTGLHAAIARDQSPAALLPAYRRLALGDPEVYRLATSGPLDRDALPDGLEEWAGSPFFLVTGDPHRAQALWAFAHGMAILEIDGRFPDASALDATWEAAARQFA